MIVRKTAAPVPFFHTGQVKPECANRSGRLVEYLGAEDGELTIVYNDGVIYHRNGAYLTFTRERLSRAELSELLHAFREANFDAIADDVPAEAVGQSPVARADLPHATSGSHSGMVTIVSPHSSSVSMPWPTARRRTPTTS